MSAMKKNLTVSLITGVVVERDAISNIVRQQMAAIAGYGRRSQGQRAHWVILAL